jgi:hypothetical protein
MTLAHDIGLASLPLGIERIEFLIEALVGIDVIHLSMNEVCIEDRTDIDLFSDPLRAIESDLPRPPRSPAA